MNTIKIYYSTSGSIEELKKDFPLYQGSYQNKLLNVYVPTSILAPNFQTQNSQGVTTADYVASTSVKIAMQYTERDGSINISTSYFMKYLKTLTYQNVEYALYERKLPKEFTLYAGQGENSPILLLNIVNILTEPVLTGSISIGANLSNLQINSTIFESQISISGNYSFVYSQSQSSWQLNNGNVQLSAYGISVDGTPDNNDLIVINYTSAPVVLSATTTQTCALEVMPSAYLDTETPIEPSEADVINARLNAIDSDLALKQNITDLSLQTTSKIIPNAINEVLQTTGEQATQIQNNTEAIASNKNQIDYILNNFAQPEHYIGQLTGTTLPTQEELTSFVQTTAGRQPNNADVVIFILQIAGETDKNYKYIYSTSGWSGYEIPPLEVASNGSLGIIEGTYAVDLTYNTLVNISGGQILNIYVKDTTGNYRDIQEYANSLNTTIQSIISGNTSVGLAVKSLQDGLGNNIVNTYLTQTAGATKSFVQNYALPRQFNDVYFIASTGYQQEVPTTPSTGIQFTTTTSAVGNFTLFQINKTAGAQFEISGKNSCQNTIYVSASEDCTAYFRLTTQGQIGGGEWTDLSVEISDLLSLTAGAITKITFGMPFTSLNGTVLNFAETDLIQQTFEVVTQSSISTTFNVYSNEVYPSSFNLNTMTQTINVSAGMLGEQPYITGTGALTDNILVFTLPNYTILNNNTECMFMLNIPTSVVASSSTQFYLLYNSQIVRVATPYNFESGYATLGDLTQINSIQNAVGGTTLYFKGFVSIDSGDNITVIVDEDNLTTIQNEIEELGNELNSTSNDLTQEITARQNADTNLQTQITTNAGNITTNANNISNIGNNTTKIANNYGGGSIGSGSSALQGFAGGNNAIADVDCIQLGTGNNNSSKTLQVYDDNIYNANTHTLYADNINTHQFNYAGEDIDFSYISYNPQTLTEDQKQQARANIGAGASAFSGAYNDLTGLPTLNTTNTTAQSTNANEVIQNQINLHKISKTGNFTDLNNIPQANTGQAGIIEIATDSEASAGTLTTVAITPKQLQTAIEGLGSVFTLKGSVQSVSNLPTAGNNIGDVYYVVDESVGYIWLNDGTTNRWEQLGLAVDLSGYVEISSIVDNLTTQAPDKPLSANQGYVLNQDLTAIETNSTLIANSSGGGSIGRGSSATSGFSGGLRAQSTVDSIQLGTGTNSAAKTLQVYDDNIYNADTHTLSVTNAMVNGTNISTELSSLSNDISTNTTDIENLINNITKIANSDGGFAGGTGARVDSGGAVGSNANTITGGAIGYNASATTGGAVGNGASATNGGAIGFGASATSGFSGGLNAKSPVDSIQLGTGTNSAAKTLQIYDDNIYNANTHTLTVDNMEINTSIASSIINAILTGSVNYGDKIIQKTFNSSRGCITFASGLKLQWGTMTPTSLQTNITTNYSEPFNSFSRVVIEQLGGGAAATEWFNAHKCISTSTSGFTWQNGQSEKPKFQYIAIGY